MKTRVGVDAIALGNGKGVSRFIESFLRAFATSPQPEVEIVAFTGVHARLDRLPQSTSIRYVPVRPGRALQWDLFGFSSELRRARADVALTFSDRARAGVSTVFYVFEVPDYRIEAMRPYATTYQRVSDAVTAMSFRGSLGRADRVVASSRSTRDDLARLYGTDPASIPVVYPAADPAFGPGDAPHERYFFHVSSNNDPRDNSPTVLRAFKRVREKIRDARLVIAGVDRLAAFGWGDLAAELELGDAVEYQGFLDTPRLRDGYRGAIAYVDPSLYEGFGFQAAEALACGTPVICSDRTSLPEVVGDAGILLAPDDFEGFTDAMVRLATDGAERARRATRSIERSKTFTWEKTADALVSELRSVARAA